MQENSNYHWDSHESKVVGTLTTPAAQESKHTSNGNEPALLHAFPATPEARKLPRPQYSQADYVKRQIV